MISCYFQALLFVALHLVDASFFQAEDVAQRLDNVFLGGNLTVDDSKVIFAGAKESYLNLKHYQKEKDPERRREVLTTLRIFTEKVVEDLSRRESDIFHIFGNINANLKGSISPSRDPEMDPEALSRVVGLILAVAEKKLEEHYTRAHRNRYDVERIFLDGTGIENLLRRDSGIDATSVGYFFLETFATILGLSWGIISMILSGIQ